MDHVVEGDEEAVDISFTARFTNAMSQLGVEQWAAKVVYMTASIDGILQGLMDGSLVGVSDGSFKDKRGTACWILETQDGCERIVGLAEVPGQEDEHDAYRSELAGLFGLVVAVKTLTELGDIKNGVVEVGCDGLSALHRSFRHGVEDICSSQPHFDILSGLHG